MGVSSYFNVYNDYIDPAAGSKNIPKADKFCT